MFEVRQYNFKVNFILFFLKKRSYFFGKIYPEIQ